MLFQSGQSIITSALGQFTAVVDKLQEGIDKVTEEKTRNEEKLAKKTAKFNEVRAEINGKITSGETDIAKATAVKSNIEAMLNG